MIEGIDAKLKVLLAEKAQSAEMEVEAPVKEAVSEEKPEVPIYRETANYAYEAGELESYRASLVTCTLPRVSSPKGAANNAYRTRL